MTSTSARSAPSAADDSAELPVARVAVDVPLLHLDRPFDYQVPPKWRAAAAPGTRVRVRFSGQLVDGFVLERTVSSDHVGRLSDISRVVSSEPVLSPEIATLARAVADRYCGSLADVLRLAIPPRHARVESELFEPGEAVPAKQAQLTTQESVDQWSPYDHGLDFVAALRNNQPIRAVCAASPGRSPWPALIQAITATRAAGRGAVVVVPDNKDVRQAHAALAQVLADHEFTSLVADLGPQERYRRWLRVRRGLTTVVVGTRSAMFAPVANLGLVAIWDDGDDLHAEPRAPYPHAREVLALRSHLAGCSLLVMGHAVTSEGAAFVERGFARPLRIPRALVRSVAPRVRAVDDAATDDGDPLARAARLPSIAWRATRDALKVGPVLVQVPRRGYVPGLACARCRTRAMCTHCHGPLMVDQHAADPSCSWCGRSADPWICRECGTKQLRSVVVGARRTAEELGKAFPGVPVITSGGDSVVAEVEHRPALVIATPGAEPTPASGYQAALLLDATMMLGRADLRVAEESLRRWINAAALVRPAPEGGRVIVVGPADQPVIQALIRWDPAGFASREYAERVQAGLPPAIRLIQLNGTSHDVDDLLTRAALPDDVTLVGPTPATEGVRVLVTCAIPRAVDVIGRLRGAQGARSARKLGEQVRVHVDPVAID